MSLLSYRFFVRIREEHYGVEVPRLIVDPFFSLGVALAIYFSIRGGLFSLSSMTPDLNLYGVTAISILVGMFAPKAMSLLQDRSDTLFRTKQKPTTKTKENSRKDQTTGSISWPHQPVAIALKRLLVVTLRMHRNSILWLDNCL